MLAGAIIFFSLALVFAAFVIVSVRMYQIRPDFVKKILKYSLILLFALIFSIIAISIGFRIDDRHSRSYSANLKSVQEIWGGNIVQQLPSLSYTEKILKTYENKKTGLQEKAMTDVLRTMGIADQKVDVRVKSNIRKKGLLKYPGFNLRFSGKYIIKNFELKRKKLSFFFSLPQGAGNITNLKALFQGRQYRSDSDFSNGIEWQGSLAPGETREFLVTYDAQGTGRFDYAMGNRKKEIKKLDVTVWTDFSESNIPDRAMVPTESGGDNEAFVYSWKAANVVTGQNIALKFGIAGNYGKTVSRLFYYSPIAIFLFLGLILVFSTAKGVALHPMHYLFIITGFFIFYLLGSYLVSYMPILLAILSALLVSTSIVVYYCYIIDKGPDIVRISLYGALLFQWIFSVAFFVPEHTGFIITIASILSFIFLMKTTALIDWENKW